MRAIIEKIVSSLYPDTCTDKEISKIYKIHKYWARKPWYIVERYISDYSKSGDIIMDPFCGSGLTGMEAVINGRNFIGRDLNPIALRVASGTLDNHFDVVSFEKDFAAITMACKERIMQLYRSKTPCPACGALMYYKQISLGPKFDGNRLGSLFCSCGKKINNIPLSSYDEQVIESFLNCEIAEWYPKTSFPKKFYKDRFSYKGITTVADMFTRRNLLALAILFREIKKAKAESRLFLELAFTNTLLHVSKLKGENVRPMGVNNYWIPDDFIEENVWFRFEERVRLIRAAKQIQSKREKVKSVQGLHYGNWSLTQCSALKPMGDECIDYFFTDPPYGDAIQYSELSFIWNAWLQETYETGEEVIINPAQNKGANEFNSLLCQSLDNIYRALKPERYFTLCFQNKNSDIWKSVIDHCKSLGLKLVDVSIYNTYGNPFNKSWSNFSPKSDIYVTFQKTDRQLDATYNLPENIESIVQEISAYMKQHGISNDNNKLYDLTISYLIWSLYLNEYPLDVSKFDIKKFTKIALDNTCETE